ncbi:hypothetical protein JG687_00005044 [Phytophthora cactorum]|uniref:Spindle pole body component n=1 Tax=Phytophthora cactorum TaxID=29920 RepID=A0A8T1UM23_9STRA|nr:hypothetical protein JG687_00005044 [Phytophthora cactorum]
MHHELFLALLGHTGDVVERRVDGFFVCKEASFLSQAQHSILNRLLRLGFAFSTLDQFVRQASKFPSVYLHALAQAVERLLHRYADAIVELEAKTLRASAVFPMSNLMFELEEFMEILPEVCGLVHRLTMETQQGQQATCVKGAKLLSAVYQSTSSGFPRVRQCMQELLYSCHRVLFKQMMAWMVYGEIVDPHKEFFVKKIDVRGAGQTIQDVNAVMWHQQFAMDLEAVPLDYFPTSVAESVFVIGKAVNILTRANQFSPREVQDVVRTMSELARRPVFDVVAVEHDVEKVRRHVASSLHEEVVVKSNFVGFLHVLKGFFLLSRGEVFQTFIERSFDMMLMKPTTKSEEDVNYGIWQEVVRDLIPEDEPWGRDFDMQVLYVSVDLAIEHLPGNMNGMRVMAQVKPSCGGENGIQSSPVVEVPMADSNNPVLRVRIQYARQEVTMTASKQIMYKKMLAVVVNDVLMVETQLDLQQALSLHAARGEYWMGLGFSSLVRLTDWSLDKYSAKSSWREGSDTNLKEHNTAVTPRELWHALHLRCNVRWPLQLLVTPDLLRSYGHLFQFCFRLKRVAHALELAWKSSTLRSKRTTGKGATFAAGTLRIRMSFVVRTLELHFQVFVIEGKFKKCVEQIESAGDFDRAKRVHETFVASVVKSCYVHTKTVASALEELLGCCWQFAEYVLQLDAMQDDAELSADRIALLDQEFHRRFEFLYSVLQISEARDLLFLLDSNGFFAAERERRKQRQ